ncbi:ATP-dependent DNA ligase [Streptomyces mirabilis]
MRLVEPVVVDQVVVDVSLDAADRWRHPVRMVRGRSDPAPDDVPHFGKE